MIDLANELSKTYEIRVKSEDLMEVYLQIPSQGSYFAGHFPKFPVLPAIAIIDISQYFAEKLLEKNSVSYALSQVTKLRIKNPISPSNKIHIQVHRENKATNFNILWKCTEDPDKIFAEVSLQVSQY